MNITPVNYILCICTDNYFDISISRKWVGISHHFSLPSNFIMVSYLAATHWLSIFSYHDCILPPRYTILSLPLSLSLSPPSLSVSHIPSLTSRTSTGDRWRMSPTCPLRRGSRHAQKRRGYGTQRTGTRHT